MSAATAQARPAWAEADIIAFPDFRHTELLVETRIKNEIKYPLKLDSDAQICRANLSPAGCPLGSSCPKRHTSPMSLNYTPAPVATTPQGRTVCKHWLRGLCKRDKECDFLHEFNLRKMPECWFFNEHGFCSQGDECMYVHVTPFQKRPECKSYVAGFCRKGPDCPLKHIRRVICPLYITGFCPDGPECKLAHPPFSESDVERMIRIAEQARKAPLDAYRNRDRDWPNAGGIVRGHIQTYTSNNGQDPYARPGMPVTSDMAFDGGRGPRRPPGDVGFMRNVTCFKCTQEGHLASHCPNPAVPGNRGGVERGKSGMPIERR